MHQYINLVHIFIKKRCKKKLFHLSLLLFLPSRILSVAVPSKISVEDVHLIAAPSVDLDKKEQQRLRKIACTPQKKQLSAEELLQHISNKLFLQGYLTTVIPSQNQNTTQITIKIIERLAKVQEIICTSTKPSDQKKLLEMLPCKEGAFLVPYQKEEAISILEEHFKKKGFANVKVSLKQTHPTKKTTSLYFSIEKGKKYFIKKITCLGNDNISRKEIVDQLAYSKEEIKNVHELTHKLFTWAIFLEGIGHLWRFFKGTPFIEKNLQAEIEIIKNYYRTKGYLNTDISYQLHYTPKGGVDIILNIIEGIQYKIGTIRWEGNLTPTQKELNQFLGYKEGDIFNIVAIQQKIADSKKGLQAFFEAKNLCLESVHIKTSQSSENQIDLIVQLEEKPIQVIDQVLITTDIPINFNVYNLFKYNGLEKGQTITQKKLKNLHNALINTHLFLPKSIDLHWKTKKGNKAVLTCNLEVKKVPTRFGLNMNSWSAGGFFSIEGIDIKKTATKKKFCAGSQKISIQIDQNIKDALGLRFDRLYSDPRRKLVFSYQDIINFSRNPIKQPITTNFTIFFEPSKYNTQSEFSKGGTIYLSGKKGEPSNMTEWNAIASYRYITSSNIPISSTQSFTGYTSKLLFSLDYIKHKVDNLFYPMKGSTLQLNAEKSFNLKLNSSPSLDTSYWRIIGTYSLYKSTDPLPSHKRPLTLKLKLSTGYSSFNTNSPVGRFFIGGQGPNLQRSLHSYYVSLRGYKSEDMPITAPGESYLGGRLFSMANIEFRYALADHIPSYAYLFCDFASGTTSIKAPLSTYGASCGIGFTTKTPLFVLGGGLAWPMTGKKSLLPKFYFQLGIQL